MSSSPLDIEGLTQRQTSLLEASGVKSTPELAKNHPEKLLRWMEEVNREQRILRRLPSLKSVSAWILQARRCSA